MQFVLFGHGDEILDRFDLLEMIRHVRSQHEFDHQGPQLTTRTVHNSNVHAMLF